MSGLSEIAATVAGSAVEYAANTDEVHRFARDDFAKTFGQNLVPTVTTKLGMDFTQS